MAAFWPTPAGMNRAAKIVVSNGPCAAPWGPAPVVGGDVAAAFRALKAGEGPDMTVLGSGELVRFLAAQGLVDALEIMIHPVAIGAGAPLFSGLATVLDFRLTGHRVFASGAAPPSHAPADAGR